MKGRQTDTEIEALKLDTSLWQREGVSTDSKKDREYKL